MHLFECKVLEQAGECVALARPAARDYAAKCRASGQPIHLVGIEFSRDARILAAFETAIG